MKLEGSTDQNEQGDKFKPVRKQKTLKKRMISRNTRLNQQTTDTSEALQTSKDKITDLPALKTLSRIKSIRKRATRSFSLASQRNSFVDAGGKLSAGRSKEGTETIINLKFTTP